MNELFAVVRSAADRAVPILTVGFLLRFSPCASFVTLLSRSTAARLAP
jgi:hypothetical protein